MTYSNNPNGEIVTVVEPDDRVEVVDRPNPLRWLWWLLGLLVLAALIWALTRACRPETATVPAPASSPTVAAEPTASPMSTVDLQCGEDRVHATVFADSIEATIGQTVVELPVAESASGVRYAGDGYTLWEHQGDWMLIRNEGAANEQTIECTTN